MKIAINLQDLRAAVLAYMNTKVTCSVSNLIAEVPKAISPKEKFKFDVSATNATIAAGGVSLKNVRYVITASNNVNLIVPEEKVGKAVSIPIPPFNMSFKLDPGKEVSGYVLTPVAYDPSALYPGETDTIKELPAIGKSLGGFSICAHIIAEVDLSYLFPECGSPNGCYKDNVV